MWFSLVALTIEEGKAKLETKRRPPVCVCACAERAGCMGKYRTRGVTILRRWPPRILVPGSLKGQSWQGGVR